MLCFFDYLLISYYCRVLSYFLSVFIYIYLLSLTAYTNNAGYKFLFVLFFFYLNIDFISTCLYIIMFISIIMLSYIAVFFRESFLLCFFFIYDNYLMSCIFYVVTYPYSLYLSLFKSFGIHIENYYTCFASMYDVMTDFNVSLLTVTQYFIYFIIVCFYYRFILNRPYFTKRIIFVNAFNFINLNHYA